MSVYTGKEQIKLGFGLMRLPQNADGSIDIAETSRMVDAFLAAEHIPAEKKTKRGIAELDLKQHLTVLERRPGYLRFTPPSGTELNINAGLMFDAFEKISGTEIYSLHVTRTAVKCSDGEIFR